MTIKFGTDGWRAIISDEFTFENVRKVAQAIADMARADAQQAELPHAPRFVVGFDTRFLSDRYAQEVAQVLAANEIQVYLTRGDTPTPMLSFAVARLGAEGGVMISASHNPPRYNGIKIKGPFGGPASSHDAQRIEMYIHQNERAGREPRIMPFAEAEKQGRIVRFDPFPAYEEHIWSLIDPTPLQGAYLDIVVDPMYGAGRKFLARLLRQAGVTVEEIHGEMNPGFGGLHPEPIGRNLQPLITRVRARKGTFGLATDGDADRIGAVDETGAFVDPHRIMALALRYLLQNRNQRGAVVKTVSTTLMLDRLAERYGLPLYETPVGFNYIVEHILQHDVLIGGEESGGITIKGHIPEGDGLLMGLLLAEIVAASGTTLQELVADLYRDVGYFAYARLDYRVARFSKSELVARLSGDSPAYLAGMPLRRVSTKDGVKYLFDDAWLLIRPSGTEPVLRIYAEAPDPSSVEALLEEGKRLGIGHVEQAL